jgi:hypothetical protein
MKLNLRQTLILLIIIWIVSSILLYKIVGFPLCVYAGLLISCMSFMDAK